MTLIGVSAGRMPISSHIVLPETRSRDVFQSAAIDAGLISALAEKTLARVQTVTKMLSLCKVRLAYAQRSSKYECG